MTVALRALCAAMVACMALTGCVYYLNPLCNDQIHNGDETDVDCGGTCGHCDLGAACRVDTDCDEGTCTRGVCTPLPCNNGVQDGAETDLDCGGGTCRKCSGGRHCSVAADCFSGTCSPGTGTCASLATLAFADAVRYESGNKTYALFSGDLNRDGHVDLVAANELDSTISVFLNAKGSDGKYASFPHSPAAVVLGNDPNGEYPTGGLIADMNHDGNPDVVTANFHGDSVTIVLNPGTGVLDIAPRSYDTVDKGETSNLALGDLNGDGNLDVIATNQSRASVSEFLGHADGTLDSSITLPVGISGASSPFSAAIGDFNGDGKADLAIAENVSAAIVVRLGNGDGTFQPEVSYPVRGTRDFVLITHDMNLDGQLDLVCANRGSDSVSVLIGRGDGTFRKAIVSMIAPSKGPYSIAVDDFNQDGVPDVVTANYLTNNSTVLLGIGDGSFEPVIDAGRTGTVPYGVATGDFDGDGKPDFATANALSNDVTVKINTSR